MSLWRENTRKTPALLPDLELSCSPRLSRKMAPPPPSCQLCKSRCASSLATGTLFGIYFQPSFLHAAIVPCNVRLEFNNLTGDTVTFEGPGGPYTMEVQKGRNMSKMGGDGWVRIIAHMDITGEDDDDPLDEVIFAQRMRLNEEETCNLMDVIPPQSVFLEVPFVTRLTSTMVDRHVMI